MEAEKTNSFVRSSILLFLLIGGAAGCGAKTQPLGTAHGKITYQSEPVGQGNVVFENRSIGCLRAGELDADGSYSVSDLAIGKYRVSIHPPEPKLPDETTIANGGRVNATPVVLPDPRNIPKQFRLTEDTPLVVDIAVGDNQFSFDLADTTQ